MSKDSRDVSKAIRGMSEVLGVISHLSTSWERNG